MMVDQVPLEALPPRAPGMAQEHVPNPATGLDNHSSSPSVKIPRKFTMAAIHGERMMEPRLLVILRR